MVHVEGGRVPLFTTPYQVNPSRKMFADNRAFEGLQNISKVSILGVRRRLVTDSSVEGNKQKGILPCPRRKLDIMDFLPRLLKNSEVMVGAVFQESVDALFSYDYKHKH